MYISRQLRMPVVGEDTDLVYKVGQLWLPAVAAVVQVALIPVPEVELASVYTPLSFCHVLRKLCFISL